MQYISEILLIKSSYFLLFYNKDWTLNVNSSNSNLSYYVAMREFCLFWLSNIDKLTQNWVCRDNFSLFFVSSSLCFPWFLDIVLFKLYSSSKLFFSMFFNSLNAPSFFSFSKPISFMSLQISSSYFKFLMSWIYFKLESSSPILHKSSSNLLTKLLYS